MLRHRPDDAPLLVDHFVKQISRLRGTLSREPVRVSAESLTLLKRYAWPGDLDELRNILRRALVETKGTIVAPDFLSAALRDKVRIAAERTSSSTDWRTFSEERVTSGSRSINTDASAEMERNLLSQILEMVQGNQARSARLLGITRGNRRKKPRALGVASASPKQTRSDLRTDAEHKPASTSPDSTDD